MSISFTPIDYLKDQDKKILNETKYKIKHVTSKSDLKYYERILDSLMKKAYRNYCEENKKKTMQPS